MTGSKTLSSSLTGVPEDLQGGGHGWNTVSQRGRGGGGGGDREQETRDHSLQVSIQVWLRLWCNGSFWVEHWQELAYTWLDYSEETTLGERSKSETSLETAVVTWEDGSSFQWEAVKDDKETELLRTLVSTFIKKGESQLG